MSLAGRRGGSSTPEYPNEAAKFLDQKSESTLRAVIDGIQDPDRARLYAREEARRDDPRKQVIAAANQRVAALTEGDDS